MVGSASWLAVLMAPGEGLCGHFLFAASGWGLWVRRSAAVGWVCGFSVAFGGGGRCCGGWWLLVAGDGGCGLWSAVVLRPVWPVCWLWLGPWALGSGYCDRQWVWRRGAGRWSMVVPLGCGVWVDGRSWCDWVCLVALSWVFRLAASFGGNGWAALVNGGVCSTWTPVSCSGVSAVPPCWAWVWVWAAVTGVVGGRARGWQ